MTELMRRNAGFLMEPQRENAENGRMMMGQLFQELNGFRRGGDLRERQFREISCFTGEVKPVEGMVFEISGCGQGSKTQSKRAVSETDEAR